MDKIAMVNQELQLRNWSEMEIARQNSGLTVTEWCRRENISQSTYYYRLRKIRESICEQIPVPITKTEDKPSQDSTEIRIACGDLQIEMPADIPTDTLTAIIGALKC